MKNDGNGSGAISPGDSDRRRLFRGQILTFSLCWAAYALIYFGRVNLSVALPALEEDLGVSKAALGLLGTAFFWIYGTGQLINGRLGDRCSSRQFVFIGLIVAALANLLFGLAGAVPVMLVLWGFNGYFQSMLWGPIVKTVSHWFSHEKRAAVAVGLSTSMAVGFLLAWGFSGHLVAVSGWRSAFQVPGAFIGAFAFLWFIFLRERPEDLGLVSPNTLHAEAAGDDGPKPGLREIFKRSRLGMTVLACFAQGIVKDGIGLWGPAFILERWNLGMDLTVKLILLVPVMNLGGMLLASRLNALTGGREKRTILILLLSAALSLGGLILWGDGPLWGGLLLLALTSAFMYGANTLLLGVIPMNFARMGAVSTVAGFLDFCSYLAAGAASVLAGLAVQHFGWDLLLVLWVLSAVLGAGAMALDLSRRRDIADKPVTV